MIIAVSEAITYCNGEELTFPHELTIDLSTGKITTDLEIKDLVYDYTDITVNTNNGEVTTGISSLTFLNQFDLKDLRELFDYKEKDVEEEEEDSADLD